MTNIWFRSDDCGILIRPVELVAEESKTVFFLHLNRDSGNRDVGHVGVADFFVVRKIRIFAPVQLSAVFQSLLVGLSFQVALPAWAGAFGISKSNPH